MAMYLICYFCQFLKCNTSEASGCNAPNCFQDCAKKLEHNNCRMGFCEKCKRSTMKSFESQFGKPPLNPPRIKGKE